MIWYLDKKQVFLILSYIYKHIGKYRIYNMYEEILMS